jgi:hypothetical protein
MNVKKVQYANPTYQKIWNSIYEKHKIDIEIIDNPQGYTTSEFLFRIATDRSDRITTPFQLARSPFGVRLEDWVEQFVDVFGFLLERVLKTKEVGD